MHDNEDNKLLLIKEACRNGENRISAQITIATSADQRATILAGIYVAASVGIIAALATYQHECRTIPIKLMCFSASLVFIISSMLCIISTFPVEFWLPGNDPKEWEIDIEKNTPIAEAIHEQASYFDNEIKQNNATMKKNAKMFKIGALMGILAPIIGVMLGGIASLLLS